MTNGNRVIRDARKLAERLHDEGRFRMADVARTSAETDRLSRELDITNADHIALWLERNLQEDGEVSLPWLACRIVEAHEAAREQSIAPYRELADRAISMVEDAVKDTSWGQPTFGPDYGEELRAEFNTLQQGAK